MASGRTYHVRYGNRSTYQAKIRPEKSPAEELFDRLVGTSSRESPTKRVSASTSDRSNRKGKRDETIKEPSSESPLQTKRRTTSYSKATYSYSPRRNVSSMKSQQKASGRSLSKPSFLSSPLTKDILEQLSDHADEDSRGRESGEKKVDKEALKVFDFDMSDDDESQSEAGMSSKRVKVDNVKQVSMSKKQTSLRQYTQTANTRSLPQASTGSNKKASKNLKLANNRKSTNTKAVGDVPAKKRTAISKSSDSDMRSTISKLLASKAEDLKARATNQSQLHDPSADLTPQSDVAPPKPATETTDEIKEVAPESINRRVKRKIPPSTATVAMKKAPPKRTKLEKLDSTSNVEVKLLPISPSSKLEKGGASSGLSEGSQAKLVNVKSNGISLSGTLVKSEIATRTRASVRELKHRGRGLELDREGDSCSSPELGADTTTDSHIQSRPSVEEYSQSSQDQETEVDSPLISESSSSQGSTRAGRPSPRYTTKGRRMSSTSTTSEKSDPYGFDTESDASATDKASLQKNLLVVQPKPSLRKSSSATSSNLTSHFAPSSARSKSSAVSRPDHHSHPEPPSSVPVYPSIPSLKKSSSWPQRPAVSTRAGGGSSLPVTQRVLSKSSLATDTNSSSSTADGQIVCPKDEKQLYTVVRNVRQAHECLEIGESQQFFDEVNYLLDSIKPSQPLGVRCLGTFNLCTHYFDTEFSRQMRAHSVTSKITSLLKDCLQHPTLCLSAAVLFYVMTRDKLNTEWDNNGAALLVGMLSKEESFFTSELSTGKAQREMTRLRNKAKTVLEKVKDQSCESPESVSCQEEEPVAASIPVSSSEDLMRGGVEGARRGAKKTDILKEKPHHVNSDSISVKELACECLISLTHHQHNPQWLRHQLRLLGGLDLVANLVISSIDDISSVDVSHCSQGSPGPSPSDYATGINNRLVTLERRLKALEHATVRNKDNQSYLVVFDGSVLLSKIVRSVAVFQNLTEHDALRPITENCLLTSFKVLLNLTHEFQLGCYRLGEQKDIMTIILNVLFQLSKQMSDEDNGFDITVLALSLLINLTEMCSSNRTLLESTKVPWLDSDVSGSQHTTTSSTDCVYGNDSSVKSLVQLFLTRFSNAESTQIQVPTPQRLSQLTSSSTHASHSQAQEPQASTSKRNLLPSFVSKTQKSPLTSSQSSCSQEEEVILSQDGKSEGGLKWLDGDLASKPAKQQSESDLDEEEALEKVDVDPLVFSREEFDAALHQAGRHMEDSIVAAYSALLLGILSKHNQETLDYVRSQMPSQSFSEMIEILKKLVSFMNMTGSATGLESIKHVVKYLQTL